MIRKVQILILVGVLVSSCGVVKRGTIPWEERAKKKSSSPPTAMSVGTTTKKLSKSEKGIKSSLDLAFKDWKGVPYILGGTGYSGVDCSSFMQIVFEDYFETKLPRTTQQQMKIGSSVKKKKIEMGDMVFFKTGRKTFHVGVMINNEQFMHASTSSGVIISNLQSSYWKDLYLTTRRVL